MNTQKKFVTVNFDKFEKATTTKTIPMERDSRYLTMAIIDARKGIGGFYAGLRHVQKPDVELLAVDVYYAFRDWMFLRNGQLSFIVDNENVSIQALDAGTDVISGGVREKAAYVITKELLEKIGSSKNFAMRISGSKGYVDIENREAQHFKTMCKQFYNNVFDSTKFAESLQTSVSSRQGCFIATAAMGNYNHPVVVDLRMFRDNWLLKREWGVKFTNWYYTHGPKAAHFIRKSKILQKMTFIFIVKPLQILSKKLI